MQTLPGWPCDPRLIEARLVVSSASPEKRAEDRISHRAGPVKFFGFGRLRGLRPCPKGRRPSGHPALAAGSSRAGLAGFALVPAPSPEAARGPSASRTASLASSPVRCSSLPLLRSAAASGRVLDPAGPPPPTSAVVHPSQRMGGSRAMGGLARPAARRARTRAPPSSEAIP